MALLRSSVRIRYAPKINPLFKMKKLIEGIVQFQKKTNNQCKKDFLSLAKSQNPQALFIGCADSRIVPSLFTTSLPGDLFIIRNMGNFVTPYAEAMNDCGTASAIEFAVCSLKVPDIIICGHSNCGAVKKILENESIQTPYLKTWLSNGIKPSERNPDILFNSDLSEEDQFSQLNVLKQIKHLKTYPFIKEKLQAGQIKIHALWFDIGNADVFYYKDNQFILITEDEGKKILKSLM